MAVIAIIFCAIPHSLFSETDKKSATSDIKPFEILFLKSKASFSGTIDSKESADAIAGAILSARPDLTVVNQGMDFNPAANIPQIKLLKSLIVEIALSTHEGVLEISDEKILIGGLTDSVVTSSVLRLRARPILGKRRLQEQICLIPSEDLPDIPILLSTGESRKTFSFDLELQQKAEVTYEPPGIILTKLLDLIEGTANPDIYPKDAPLVAEPVRMPQPELTIAPELRIEKQPEVEPPPPPSPYQFFGPITFIRNGIVLQAGQKEMIASLPSTFREPTWADRPIIVRSMIYQSGSKAFSSWISERRMAEAVRHLKDAGVPPHLLKPETVATTEKIDKGEVQLLILKPEDYLTPQTEDSEPAP